MTAKASRRTPRSTPQDETLRAAKRRKVTPRSSYPNARFAFALERVGLSGLAQEHRALRSLVHTALGAPPADHCSTNALAEKVLELVETGSLPDLQPV